MQGAVCPRWRPGRRKMETGGGGTLRWPCAPRHAEKQGALKTCKWWSQAHGDGTLGPQSEGRGWAEQVAREGPAMWAAWPWVPPRGSGGPEGSGRPARPPTSKSDITESLRRGGVRWWPGLLGTAVCPPARPLGDAGEEGSSGVPCQGLQAHGGQPPAGRRWRGPACCPARPLPGPRPLPHSTPSPPRAAPPSRPRGCGRRPRKSRGAGDSPGEAGTMPRCGPAGVGCHPSPPAARCKAPRLPPVSPRWPLGA